MMTYRFAVIIFYIVHSFYCASLGIRLVSQHCSERGLYVQSPCRWAEMRHYGSHTDLYLPCSEMHSLVGALKKSFICLQH